MAQNKTRTEKHIFYTGLRTPMFYIEPGRGMEVSCDDIPEIGTKFYIPWFGDMLEVVVEYVAFIKKTGIYYIHVKTLKHLEQWEVT